MIDCDTWGKLVTGFWKGEASEGKKEGGGENIFIACASFD